MDHRAIGVHSCRECGLIADRDAVSAALAVHLVFDEPDEPSTALRSRVRPRALPFLAQYWGGKTPCPGHHHLSQTQVDICNRRTWTVRLRSGRAAGEPAGLWTRSPGRPHTREAAVTSLRPRWRERRAGRHRHEPLRGHG